MTTSQRATLAVAVGLATLAAALPAPAVIKVEIPVSKIYDDSNTVILGTVALVNPQNCVVDVKVDQSIKGQAVGDSLRVQVAAPAGFIKQVAVGLPVVIFLGEREGKPLAVIHLADSWLLADGLPGTTPPAWRVVQPFDGARSFPGRTAALVRIVAELKAGKPTLLDVTNPEALRGPVRELANLALRPTFLVAADINADANLDLLVGSADGVRLFLATSKGYADATAQWGLANAAATHCAVADINADGRPDLLLGPALWLNEGSRFSRLKTALDLPPESDWLAAALADVTGDRRPDVVILLKTASLVTRQNPGAPDKPWTQAARNLGERADQPLAAAFSNDWGDNAELHALVVRANRITRYPVGPAGGPPADLPRLTGLNPTLDAALPDKPHTLLFATPIDSNGDRRTDLLILTEAGASLLINRGFGAFFHSTTIHSVFSVSDEKPLPFKLAPGILAASGRPQAPDCPRQRLLVLTQEGRLFEIENPPQ